jgi:2'-5' RNA ligase
VTAGPTAGAAGARRLFFALWPDEPTRQAIQKVSATAVRKCGGRPVPPANYHITLAFLGNQPAALFDAIVTVGRAIPARQPGFSVELQLDRFLYWSRPRVFLLGLSENPVTLSSLANDIWDELELLGIERGRRALLPHVTLSRKVERAPVVDAPPPVHWTAGVFVLVESVTAPGGAEYTVVGRFPDN